MNGALRSGEGLGRRCAIDLCNAGYASNGQVVKAAESVFNALGPALDLNSPINAYRGLRSSPTDYLAALNPNISPPTRVEEPGFVFAAPTPEEAAFYQGKDAWWARPDPPSMLLQLEIHRAICIPHPDDRSRELVAHLARTRRVNPSPTRPKPEHQHPTQLESAKGQLIVAPGSRWAASASAPPGHESVTVILRQVLD